MDEPEDAGEVEITIETDAIDVDEDGIVDLVTEVTTIVADLDGDGVPDVIERTTVTGYDLDGDGVPDAIDRTTVLRLIPRPAVRLACGSMSTHRTR